MKKVKYLSKIQLLEYLNTSTIEEMIATLTANLVACTVPKEVELLDREIGQLRLILMRKRAQISILNDKSLYP